MAKEKISFYTKFAHPPKVTKKFEKASLTDQSQSYDADINNIVNAMAIVPQQAKEPIFGITFNPDMYQDALNVVATAKSEFEKLPAKVRQEFGSPENLVKFIDEAPNDELLAKKGVDLGVFNSNILDAFKKVEQPTLQGDTPSQVTETVTQ